MVIVREQDYSVKMCVSAVHPAINHSEACEIDRCLHRVRLGVKVGFREERAQVENVCVCENQFNNAVGKDRWAEIVSGFVLGEWRWKFVCVCVFMNNMSVE